MRPSSAASLKAYIVGLAGLLVYSIVSAVLSELSIQLGLASHIVNILFQWLAFAFPALRYYQKHAKLAPSFRLQPFRPFTAVTIVLAASIGTLVLNWISIYWVMILKAIGLTVDTGSSLIPENGTQLLWVLGYAVLSPAVFEEILFRGFLLPSLEPSGRRFAITVSALLFALLHGSLEALPAHIILGVLLALLVLSTGSLYAAMLYHAVHNAVIVVMGYISQRNALQASSGLPTMADVFAAAPAVVFLLMLWVFLLAYSIRQGEMKQKLSPPQAERSPLQKTSKILLIIIGALLLLMQGITVYNMLPGAPAA